MDDVELVSPEFLRERLKVADVKLGKAETLLHDLQQQIKQKDKDHALAMLSQQGKYEIKMAIGSDDFGSTAEMILDSTKILPGEKGPIFEFMGKQFTSANEQIEFAKQDEKLKQLFPSQNTNLANQQRAAKLAKANKLDVREVIARDGVGKAIEIFKQNPNRLG